MTRLTLLLAGSALAGCAATTAPPTVAAAPVAEAAPLPEAAPAPKARIGAFGFDDTGMDANVRAGDDFYEFANGAWAKRTEIPADKSNYGMFTVLGDTSQERVRDLLEVAKDDPNRRIGAVYASFLDDAAVEARGLTPLKPWLDEVRALDSRGGVATLMAHAARNGVAGLFGGGVGQDDRHSDQYIFALGQGGLGMPDRDFYLDNSARMKTVRAAYLKHLANTLTLAGEANAAARAQAILAFETNIAKVWWNRDDSSDAVKIYNRMSVARLVRLAPGFDFSTYLKDRGADPSSELLVAQPSAFTGIARLANRAPLGVLRDQLIVRSVDAFADVLPKAVTDENFAFYGTVINGTPQLQPRWKRAADFTSLVLTDEVSKLYVAKYFPPESKAAMQKLVGNVLSALGDRIDKLEWMAPETKAKAQDKVRAFTVRVGYPDQWHDYSSLAVARDDLFGNALRANQWSYDWNLGKLGKPIYRWEWLLDPMTVNANAEFGIVTISFPAAILQPPFFDPYADDAFNYGGIGAVIGHEISHHFDDQGSKYDAKGNLVDWWTAVDVANFKALTKKLVEQYDKYEVFPGEHLKGEFTLGENMGDLAGIQIAYDAYHKALGGREAPVLGGMTGDQRFYLGWAQVWRRNYREANLHSRIVTDPHSPSIQRTWIVRNFDPWYQAYDVQPDQKLYLPPDQRVRVW